MEVNSRSLVTRRRFLSGIAGIGAAGLANGDISAQTASPVATPCPDPVISTKNAQIQVVLRDYTTVLTDAEMDTLVSVIGTQIKRDFAPIWGVDASVIKWQVDVPITDGQWQVKILSGKIDSGHDIDSTNVPYAEVLYDYDQYDLNQLTHVVSHECLEMLTNPYGVKLHLLDAPPSAQYQGKVLYHHEICDPCASFAAGYKIQCYTVSDFVLPSYFEPVPASSGNARFSLVGGVTQPRTPMLLGYQYYDLLTLGEPWIYDYRTPPLVPREDEAHEAK